ncbi:7-carboxy-7-deazaguanine synthase QueE, partial [Duncaniella muris]
MSYRINEIFYSLQGEGYFTGTPAVFLRMSGCNLKCGFCDTRHEEHTLMSPAQIVEAIGQYPTRHIIITGGEPSLQLDQMLVDLLHDEGWFIQIET